jgi:hypothetical protein
MTSLTETLPILDEAVPALPDKIEAVAREGDAFGRAAVDALATIHQKREQAGAAVRQVRDALATVRDQAGEQQQALQTASQDLHRQVEEEADDVDAKGEDLKGAGGQAVTLLGQLESALAQGTDRTRTAHEEARAALEALAEEARTSQPELDGAVDEMVSGLQAAEQRIGEGETLVVEGATALLGAMGRLLGETQTRLQETRRRLDALRQEQESAVTEAAAELETVRERLGQDVGQRLDSGLKQVIDPELEAVLQSLGEMGQDVLGLQTETRSRREDLEEEIAALGDRIPSLQGGVGQVKAAAEQVGIVWP